MLASTGSLVRGGRKVCPPFGLTLCKGPPIGVRSGKLAAAFFSFLGMGNLIPAARINAAAPPAQAPTTRDRSAVDPLGRAQSGPTSSGLGRVRAVPRQRLRCSPGGSQPRASRGPRHLTPRLRSSGRIAARSRGAPLAARAVGRRRPAAPRRLDLALGPPHASASGLPRPRRHRARPSAHPARQPRRGVVTPPAQSRVRSRCPHRRGSGHAGGKAPRDPPAPLRPEVRAQRHRSGAMPATASPPAPLRPWRQGARGAAQADRPERAWRARPPRRAAALIESAAPRPGGPSCARPRRRCWRVRYGGPWQRLRPAAAAPPKQARRGASGSHAMAGANRGTASKEAGDGTPAGAGLAGRSRDLFRPHGQCLGPRAPVGRQRQPRSLRSAPLRGRLRRGFDPAARQAQPLIVAAARRAPGAMPHSDRAGRSTRRAAQQTRPGDTPDPGSDRAAPARFRCALQRKGFAPALSAGNETRPPPRRQPPAQHTVFRQTSPRGKRPFAGHDRPGLAAR
jgi:hypothetical protein